MNVQVPIFFKNIIDALDVPLSADSTVWIVCGSVILACASPKVSLIPSDPLTHPIDGGARIGATLFGELLNAVFANVGQRAVRTVARETFEHLLNLDMRFHLDRQT